MSSAQITELTLAGFQVFSEPCSIPFGRLTLLFGPGSAGKTAIGHGLSVIQSYCSVFRLPGHNQAEDLGERLAQLLDRHWRQQAGGSAQNPALLAPEVLLDLRIQSPRQAWATQSMAKRRRVGDQVQLVTAERRYEGLMTALAPWIRAAEHFELGFQLRAERPGSAHTPSRVRGRVVTGPSLRHTALVLIDGEPVLRLDSHGAIAVRLSHPALKGKLDLKPLQRLTSRYPSQCAGDNDWFSVVGGDHLRSIGLASGTLAGLTRQENPGTLLDADDLASFSLLEGCVNGLWLSTTRLVAEVADLTAVSASRTVPGAAELSFLKNGAGQDVSVGRVGLQARGRPELENLAAEGLWESVKIAGRDELSRPVNLRSELEHVNRLLCDVLFRDRGLYLTFDVHALDDLSIPGDGLIGQMQDHADSRGLFVVNVKVGDIDGHRLNIDQMGGGMGQVLPVLLALSQPHGTWVQHPELQLHPATQAQLADAYLISGEGLATQHLIETHSDLFLLRLLRRIRQTQALDQVANPAFKLAADQLRLVHISPATDGVTRVKRIRVAPDGEIIDRWPGGFFEERWQELFDE